MVWPRNGYLDAHDPVGGRAPGQRDALRRQGQLVRAAADQREYEAATAIGRFAVPAVEKDLHTRNSVLPGLLLAVAVRVQVHDTIQAAAARRARIAQPRCLVWGSRCTPPSEGAQKLLGPAFFDAANN